MENKRELLKKVFANEEVKRVPVGFWHHFILGKEQFRGLEDENILKRAVDGHKKYYETINPDMMKLMNEGFMGYPPVMENKLQNGEDLLKIKSIGEDHPWIKEQVKHVKKLVDLFKDEVLTFYNVFAPLQVIRIKLEFHDLDFDRFVYLAENFPKELNTAGLEIQKDLKILVKKIFEETDLDGIYYCVQNIQSEKYSKEVYDKYIKTTELDLLDFANKYSKYNILHVCGYAGHKNNLLYYKDYKAGAYNWASFIENISVEEGRKIFGAKCVMGGFANSPGTLIDTGSDNELSEYTHNLILNNGYKGYIIGADCSVPNDIDDDRLRIISDASHKYQKIKYNK